MNLLASLSLATGLVVASVSDLSCLLYKPAERSLTTQTTTALFLDPGLTRMLPPVYFCGESVPLHEEAVARRLVSALARNTNQNQAVYRIRQRAAVFFPNHRTDSIQASYSARFQILTLGRKCADRDGRIA